MKAVEDEFAAFKNFEAKTPLFPKKPAIREKGVLTDFGKTRAEALEKAREKKLAADLFTKPSKRIRRCARFERATAKHSCA